MIHVSAQSSHKKIKSMGGHGILFKIGVVGHGVTKINEANEITRKFVKNEIWLDLHLIHNKSNISLHIRKGLGFFLESFNVFLVDSCFVFKIVLVIPKHTLTRKDNSTTVP